MKSRNASFAALLLLLCLSGLASFLASCGSSSKTTTTTTTNTNQPLDMTTGTWTMTSTSTSGSSNNTFTVKFTTFACSETNVFVGPTWGTGSNPFSTSPGVCLNGGTPTSTTSGFTPQGLVIEVGANPVAANGTTTLVSGSAYFAALDANNGDSDLYDLTGTVTASSQSISGSYTCDPSCTDCSGESGTFNGTMN
jgi:hypothetical protein